MDLRGDLTASVDGAVTFTYTVRNAGDGAANLTFSSGQQFDVAVSQGGEEVWRWSDGKMFTMALQQAELGPGESETFTAEWESPEGGSYEATATLAANGADAAATVTFEV